MLAGKLVQFHFNQFFGWCATVDNLLVFNPWFNCCFSSYKSCKSVAKFVARKGFFPGMKPSKWRLRLER